MKSQVNKTSDRECIRLYHMEINALAGYIIAEAGVLSARMLGLTSITYTDILILSLVVNFTTLFFIIYLKTGKDISNRLIQLFFLIQLIIYISMYSIAVIQANEFRNLLLVYAMLAVCSLLPFATGLEAFMVSLTSVIAHIGATYIAIHSLRQQGNFIHDLVYTLSFCPAIAMIIYVSRQINIQKFKIHNSMNLVEDMNRKLVVINHELENTNRIASEEINLAASLQKSILPELPDSIEGWDIALSFRPKYGVSGDIYDFYMDRTKLNGMAVFDVSGHGVSSALLTMIVKPMAYRLFSHMKDRPLTEIIREVNASVSRETSRLNDFITCVMLRFAGDSAEYVSAGHPDPCIRRGNSGQVEIVGKNDISYKGEPIGINMSNIQPTSIIFAVAPGDTLLLFTDCILESRNRLNEVYGRERLMMSLSRAPDGSSDEILEYMLHEFSLFTDGVEITDDFTVIVAKKIS